MKRQQLLKRSIIGLMGLVALAAWSGGIGLIVTNGLGMPADWLQGTWFGSSYIGPGLILAVIVGGSFTLALVAYLRNSVWAPEVSATAGFGLLIWILVELYLIPERSWLQVAMFGAGVLTLILTMFQLRLAPGAPVAVLPVPRPTTAEHRRFTRALFAATIIFILHGIEEYQGELWQDDPITRWFIDGLSQLSVEQAIFVIFHVMFWMILMASLLTRWRRWGVPTLMTFFGVIMILEFYHVFFALDTHAYQVGAITATLLLLCAAYYWYALVRTWWQILFLKNSSTAPGKNTPEVHPHWSRSLHRFQRPIKNWFPPQ